MKNHQHGYPERDYQQNHDHTIQTILNINIYLASPYLATSSNLSLLQVTIAHATSLKIIDINLLDVKQLVIIIRKIVIKTQATSLKILTSRPGAFLISFCW